jgi:DNA-directed RNA polymerase subunit RPC12/RpoP
MLKDGQCQQCGSRAVVTSAQGIGWGSLLEITDENGGDRSEEWTTYLCVDCGLFENRVTSVSYLAAVKSDPARQGWQSL